MAGQKFSERTVTTTKVSGMIPINVPTGGGDYVTKMISATNLLSGLGGGGLIINNVGDIEQVLTVAANTYINMVSCRKLTGTPTITIGTTTGGVEILAATEVTDELFQTLLNAYYLTETTLYINIADGTVDIRIDLIENYF